MFLLLRSPLKLLCPVLLHLLFFIAAKFFREKGFTVFQNWLLSVIFLTLRLLQKSFFDFRAIVSVQIPEILSSETVKEVWLFFKNLLYRCNCFIAPIVNFVNFLVCWLKSIYLRPFEACSFFNNRSSQQRCSVRKGVLRNFTKSTGVFLWILLNF